MGAGLIDSPPLPHDALEAFLSDTRARLEALEEIVYGETLFSVRIYHVEFRVRWIRRWHRPVATLDRARSEATIR